MQVFVVIQGAILARVHRTQFHLAPGGIFLVPKGKSRRASISTQQGADIIPASSPRSGNTYSIENIGRRPAKLVFSQAKNASTELFPSPADVATGTSPERGESSAAAGQESFGEMTFSQPGRGAGKRRAVDESLEEEDN